MNYYVVYDVQSGEVVNNVMSSVAYSIDDTSLAVIKVCEDDYRKSCNQLHYVNNGVLVQMDSQPSFNHIYDYATHQWVDSRSLDEIKNNMWNDLKAIRDQLEFGGFEFEGNVYDSDQISQGRITLAAMSNMDQIWTLADNSTIALSSLQMQQLCTALQTHVTSIHERGRIARQRVFDSETKEQVENIEL